MSTIYDLDYLRRRLIDTSALARDYMGRVIVGSTDFMGRALIDTNPPPPTETFTIWRDQVPDQGDIDGPLNLGIIWHSTDAGTVSAMRWYSFPSSGAAPADLVLYDAVGALLATATITPAADGWNSYPLDVPVAVDADTDYVAVAHVAALTIYRWDNVYTFPSPDPPVIATGCLYDYGATLAFPTSPQNSSLYALDVQVEIPV